MAKQRSPRGGGRSGRRTNRAWLPQCGKVDEVRVGVEDSDAIRGKNVIVVWLALASWADWVGGGAVRREGLFWDGSLCSLERVGNQSKRPQRGISGTQGCYRDDEEYCVSMQR